MVGHARLACACDEAGHWMSGLARAEQAVRREEVKGAASENRTLSLSVRARGKEEEKKTYSLIYKKKVLGVSSIYLFY